MVGKGEFCTHIHALTVSVTLLNSASFFLVCRHTQAHTHTHKPAHTSNCIFSSSPKLNELFRRPQTVTIMWWCVGQINYARARAAHQSDVSASQRPCHAGNPSALRHPPPSPPFFAPPAVALVFFPPPPPCKGERPGYLFNTRFSATWPLNTAQVCFCWQPASERLHSVWWQARQSEGMEGERGRQSAPFFCFFLFCFCSHAHDDNGFITLTQNIYVTCLLVP